MALNFAAGLEASRERCEKQGTPLPAATSICRNWSGQRIDPERLGLPVGDDFASFEAAGIRPQDASGLWAFNDDRYGIAKRQIVDMNGSDLISGDHGVKQVPWRGSVV